MIKSMTAFGRARETVNGLDVTVELRSVNNRYLDCTVRLPRAFSFLEEKIKPYLQAKGIKRGKLEVAVTMDAVDTPEASVSLDEKYDCTSVSNYTLSTAAIQRDCLENRNIS